MKVAALLLASLGVFGVDAARIRRRGAGAFKFPNRVCLAGSPNLYFTMIGEKTDKDGMFLIPDAQMPLHRQHMGYTDADIAQYWEGVLVFCDFKLWSQIFFHSFLL